MRTGNGQIRLIVAFFCVLCLLTSGCGDSKQSERQSAARRFLQLDQAQKALEALGDVGSSTAAESHYLKALALERLGNQQAAVAEIEAAIEQDSDNSKFKGLQLRLRLFQGERESVDQLIDLYKQGASSAALSLFATYAYQAKMVRSTSQKKPRAAKVQSANALAALKTSLALAAEVPELQREILEFAIKYRLAESATTLVDTLLEIDPEDPFLLKDKVAVLVLLGDMDRAAKVAEKLYRNQGNSSATALLFAAVLSNKKTKANSDYDKAFLELSEKHPRNSKIATSYAIYLARSQRVEKACQALHETIGRQKDKDIRWDLISTAIYLPLEAGASTLASQQLERYRAEVPALYGKYFEGRLLFLEKKHSQALAKMMEIVKAQRKQVDSPRELASEALIWIRRIMDDKVITSQLESALKAAQGKKTSNDVKKSESGTVNVPEPKKQKQHVKPQKQGPEKPSKR